MKGLEISDRQRRVVGLAFLVLCVLLTWHDPLALGTGLDPSWEQATEFAVKAGRIFGRDYVFTYGPYHYLATRLFDPATFGRVLAYDAFAVVAVFWTAIRERSLLSLAGILVSFVLIQTASDALTACALFGVFLMTLRGRIWWSLLFVALCAPLLLAKFSFGLVMLPLVLLADAYRIARRRLPLFTLTLVLATLAAYLAAGQPLNALHDLVVNSLAIILGYGNAMQWPGPKAELVSAVSLAGMAALTSLLLARQAAAGETGRARLEPYFAWLGFVWTLFVAFKMGFVRQDLHTLNYHQAAPLAFALVVGALDRAPASRRLVATVSTAAFALLVAGSVYWRSDITRENLQIPPRPLAEISRALDEVAPRLEQGLGWASGQRWAAAVQERRALEANLKRTFPRTVSGSIDVVPWDSAVLIRSGVNYQPRPVVQSYSAYTPALQALDRAYFEQRAPDTLFLKIQDIDNRLPTLALGPSLPVIGARYDAVDSDPLGLILTRRAQPRPMTSVRTPETTAPFGTWAAAPRTPALVMAHIRMRPTLAGRVMGFLYRQPLATITLRDTMGRESTYRFIPGMAELGTAISPIPSSWEMAAPMLLDPARTGGATPVAAIKLNARAWAFETPKVWFETVRLEPGFSARLQGLPNIVSDLLGSDPQHAVTYDGNEIFAHAPSVMNIVLAQPLHLRGVAGLRAQPVGTPPGDGVRFTITALRDGKATPLYDHLVRPGDAPASFDVQAPAGSRLQMRTGINGTADYDWSYWGQLELVR